MKVIILDRKKGSKLCYMLKLVPVKLAAVNEAGPKRLNVAQWFAIQTCPNGMLEIDILFTDL